MKSFKPLRRVNFASSQHVQITIPEFTKERFLSRVAKARALVPLRKKFALIYFLYIFSSTYRCTLFLTFLRSHLFSLSVHMFIVYVYY